MFYFLFFLPGDGQPDSHHGAAALGVGDVKGSLMEADDLIAHRKADAAAPGLGAALDRKSVV